jgi:uncharacterized protein (TIGR02246 family)
MDHRALQDFATRYTAAWCSQQAQSVAAFYAERGSLTINGGTPSVGREAITAAAQGFMSAFPDMVVAMDAVEAVGTDPRRAIYRWTLTGTNTGAGGTGAAVRISGREEWTLGDDGSIAVSEGFFDQADYERQLGVLGRPPLDVILRRFESPDEVRHFEKGKLELVTIGGTTVGRATYQPGWKWSVHVGPQVGASRCTVEHLGLVLAGHGAAAFDDGRVFDLTVGTLFYIPPDPHDSWVVGDQPYVSLHLMGAAHYAR